MPNILFRIAVKWSLICSMGFTLALAFYVGVSKQECANAKQYTLQQLTDMGLQQCR